MRELCIIQWYSGKKCNAFNESVENDTLSTDLLKALTTKVCLLMNKNNRCIII